MRHILSISRRLIFCALFAALITGQGALKANTDESERFNQYFIKAAAKAMPSVVNIVVYDRIPDTQGYTYNKIADGTGTIFSTDGFIVTNYHVVSRGNYYQVITYDGRKYEASNIGGDSAPLADIKTGLALLQIRNAGGASFIPIKASNDKLREGEWVLGIGNPYGLSPSITSGIVSSIGRDNIGFVDTEDFIQSDVSINPGNSGGPLINLKGEMVGINTVIRTVTGGYQGISFSIPVSMVNHLVAELQQYGRVRRGWLGLVVRERPQKESEEPSMFVEIASVIKDSPADETGLLEGDIIYEADGQPVTSIGRFMTILGSKSIGSSVGLLIAREEHFHEYALPLREKEVSRRLRDGAREIFQAYGLVVDDNIATNTVVVSYVDPDSAFLQLAPGDNIVSINKNSVSGVEELLQIFYNSGKVIDRLEVSRNDVILEVFGEHPTRK